MLLGSVKKISGNLVMTGAQQIIIHVSQQKGKIVWYKTYKVKAMGEAWRQEWSNQNSFIPITILF